MEDSKQQLLPNYSKFLLGAKVVTVLQACAPGGCWDAGCPEQELSSDPH